MTQNRGLVHYSDQARRGHGVCRPGGAGTLDVAGGFFSLFLVLVVVQQPTVLVIAFDTYHLQLLLYWFCMRNCVPLPALRRSCTTPFRLVRHFGLEFGSTRITSSTPCSKNLYWHGVAYAYRMWEQQEKEDIKVVEYIIVHTSSVHT